MRQRHRDLGEQCSQLSQRRCINSYFVIESKSVVRASDPIGLRLCLFELSWCTSICDDAG